MPEANSPQNIEEVVKKGNQIYDALQKSLNLEGSLQSKYIAIEADSEEHFIGETRDEAVKNARQKFPNAILFVRKIGGLDKVARNYPFSTSNALKYARLF